MDTIQKSSWHSRVTVKKGDIGEQIVNDWLLDHDYIPYVPDIKGGAHPFDKLCASRDKRKIFVAEIKSKPARIYYPDTGININSYQEYKFIQDKYGIDVYVIFVDEDAGRIYGNLLRSLDKPCEIIHDQKILKYPLEHKGIIYFPIQSMITIGEITEQQKLELQKLSTRKDDYRP